MKEVVTVQEQLRRYAGQLENWPGMKALIPALTFAADVIDDQARRIKALEAGLPGTGVVRSPENAPSREDGAAPVPPDPAHICADDDEC